MKPKGIFLNSKKAACSIWESGKMAYDVLSKSDNYALEYSEATTIGNDYDFYVYNQHNAVNNWMNETIFKSLKNPVFCLVTEVSHNDYSIGSIPQHFNHYMVIDPTIHETYRIHAFPRPLEEFPVSEYVDAGYPVIGSFGFATPDKDWHKIVIGVQNEFDNAVIRFNIPQATYVHEHSYAVQKVQSLCQRQITKAGILLSITTDYMDKAQLIKWCSENTLNCFMYHRSHSHPTGLAAVVDQAISSKRPLLVSSDPTFRHVHKYIKPYPELSFKGAIENGDIVEKIFTEWSSKHFIKKFENILFSIK